MSEVQYRASYVKGQAYWVLTTGEDELILAYRGVWTLLVDEDLIERYIYPAADVREWLDAHSDVLTAEIAAAALRDRIDEYLREAETVRARCLTPVSMARELDSILRRSSLES